MLMFPSVLPARLKFSSNKKQKKEIILPDVPVKTKTILRWEGYHKQWVADIYVPRTYKDGRDDYDNYKFHVEGEGKTKQKATKQALKNLKIKAAGTVSEQDSLLTINYNDLPNRSFWERYRNSILTTLIIASIVTFSTMLVFTMTGGKSNKQICIEKAHNKIANVKEIQTEQGNKAFEFTSDKGEKVTIAPGSDGQHQEKVGDPYCFNN